jgi:hypothetical protein
MSSTVAVALIGLVGSIIVALINKGEISGRSFGSGALLALAFMAILMGAIELKGGEYGTSFRYYFVAALIWGTRRYFFPPLP